MSNKPTLLIVLMLISVLLVSGCIEREEYRLPDMDLNLSIETMCSRGCTSTYNSIPYDIRETYENEWIECNLRCIKLEEKERLGSCTICPNNDCICHDICNVDEDYCKSILNDSSTSSISWYRYVDLGNHGITISFNHVNGEEFDVYEKTK